ncbi:hypothetical protein PUNSTDRAFT_116689 [Punctularia strigosozonata HHB-11173 SS5]|uniref:very-long-chain enoyl-CoA reductase n=1 Tax=Punctularia strigosozonata (strain HHB-11173) TaxID=741275 RepID=R7S2D4_PUNST|nr:uncharacterized protein PUNSTDRAFT_116689 [Punctularia strigosozonata HHB-11173 SS5]EIN03942.1 hypothetical protein PUNSTDRAFT_116689 [Punctularia strigosozonata HHB-11173 SS5]
MPSVTVNSAGRSPAVARGLAWPVTLDLPEDATIGDVKSALAKRCPKFYKERQKISVKDDRKALDDATRLADVSSELAVKDLGPQISWRTVFMIEYVGPLIIHPLIYNLPRIFYGGPVQHSRLQQYVYAMVLLHFLKREIETVFVHRFSHATMPFRNIFKNSAHYHLLSGLLLAYSVYSPPFSAPSPYIRGTVRDDPTWLNAYAAAWLFAELSNLHTHLTLRSLRPEGTTKRAVPYGYGFDLVSCPNYFFEICAWVVITLMTGSYAAWLFLVVGTGQMALWALKKHKAYKKEFGTEYPKGRKAMIPYIF